MGRPSDIRLTVLEQHFTWLPQPARANFSGFQTVAWSEELSSDMIRQLERIMGHPLKRETLQDFDYTVPAPPRHGHAMHDGSRPPRRAPIPTSYGKNRLAPRRRK